MGALTYHPENEISVGEIQIDLDFIARECKKILQSQPLENLDGLYYLGGTSGGAQPKNMTHLDNKDWIIKFPAHVDKADAGIMEYEYSLCAKECGIPMTETRLFPSKECEGYFGIERFDRIGGERKHMLIVAALLELDFREPNMDYHELMKLTKIITGDNKMDIETMFRMMCFNVFAHNMDDHSKNFTYIYDDTKDIWHLSPEYDLTYSTTYYGEHTTSINGNGRNPSKEDLMKVGVTAGMKKEICFDIMDMIQTKVIDRLQKFI